jgi:hypothetical protein
MPKLRTLRFHRVAGTPSFGVAVGIAVICLLTTASCSQSASGSSQAGTQGVKQEVGHERVLLLPPMRGGEGGWCMTLDAGECPTLSAPTSLAPIVAEDWSGGGPSVDVGVVLTTNQVMTVSVNDGPVVSTRTEQALPDGLRTAVVKLFGGPLRQVPGIPGGVHNLPLRSLRFTPLDRRNKPISQIGHPSAPLVFNVAGRRWSQQASPPQGICEISAARLGGLVFQGGFVVSSSNFHTVLVGEPLLSCVSASFSLERWPLIASVLLSAAHPGSAPPSLPAMQPLSGHPGIFQGPGVEGETIARRLPGAWLVVAKGQGLRQRLTLLEHLHVTMHL